MGEKTVAINVALTVAGNETLDKTAKQLGAKKVEVLTRLVTWFACQPEKIRLHIMIHKEMPGAAATLIAAQRDEEEQKRTKAEKPISTAKSSAG